MRLTGRDASFTNTSPRTVSWRQATARSYGAFTTKGDKIHQPYSGAHLRMNVTGVVLTRTGEFYALEFSHSDTEIFQIFLDHANRDINNLLSEL